MSRRLLLEKSGPIIIKPQNKYTFTSADSTIRFLLPRNCFDFGTIALYATVTSSTATSSFPETCGAAALIKTLSFNAGGISVDNITEYNSYVANVLTSRESYGSNSVRAGGYSQIYGRGNTLPITPATRDYRIPLMFSFANGGFKVNLNNFQAATELILHLEDDSIAFFDTAGAPTYTISNVWIEMYSCNRIETIPLKQGAVLNVTAVSAAGVVPAATSGSLRFPLECSSALRVIANLNEDVTGYITATDDKFRSDVTNVTSMSLNVGGRSFPDVALGGQSAVTEIYSLSYAANFPTRKTNRIHDDFITLTDFDDKHGFITFPLFGRTPKIQLSPNDINEYYIGSPIKSTDAFIYTQSAALGTTVKAWLQFNRKLLFNNSSFTYHDIW